MKLNRFILLLFICLLSGKTFSQKSNIWLTYGQSKFIYSPGLEANYLFNKYIGIQAGVNAYIQVYDPKQVVNVSDEKLFNFYNANLGLCSYILHKKKHKFGATVGFKAYLGPEYNVLHYYEDGGYYIYYDSADFEFDFGVDFGIFYTFRRFSTILKFETARNKIRFGVGYALKKSTSKVK